MIWRIESGFDFTKLPQPGSGAQTLETNSDNIYAQKLIVVKPLDVVCNFKTLSFDFHLSI